MNEQPPKVKENIETIPTGREVREVFDQLFRLAKNEKIKTIRRAEDSKGLYLWTIKVPTTDGHAEYEYIRKGDYEPQEQNGRIQTMETHIHYATFNLDDFPTGGAVKARFIDNEWIILE